MPPFSPKHLLRQRLLAERQALAPHVAHHAAEWAATHAMQIVQRIPADAIIGLYAPFRGELDCFPLATALKKQGYSLALPAITLAVEKPYPMVFREWDGVTPLEKGYAGIAQPSETQAVVFPDLVFVPLVGFDRQGYRLGYGQGFYDRVIPLLRLRKKCCFYGLGYAMQEVPHVPHEVHDIPLDGIVTEREIMAVHKKVG